MPNLRQCLRAVVKLPDAEVTEILDLASALRKADVSHTEETAVRDAVKQLIAQLEGATPAKPAAKPKVATPTEAAPAEPPVKATPLGGMAATLTGKKTTADSIAERIQKENNDGFTTKVNAAHAAGDIDRNRADTLIEMAKQDARGMAKAKDELIRLRERAADRRLAQKAAGKVWEDPDFSFQEGDPRWSELSEKQRETWTDAVRANKATGELYDQIVAEHKALGYVPKVDDAGDVKAATRSLTNPDLPNETTIDPTRPEFKDGKTAAAWLADNLDRHPEMAEIARKLIKYLDDGVKLHLAVSPDDPVVPPSVAKVLRTPGNAGATIINPATGVNEVYTAKGKPVKDLTVLHELLHAATQRALAMLGPKHPTRAELTKLQRTITKALKEFAQYAPNVSDEFRNDAQFFGQVVDSADELIAYTFSSPTFARMLQAFKPDGTVRSLAEDIADDNTRKQADRMFEAPDEPTLWQRVVDWLMSLVGLDPKYRTRYEEALHQAESEKVAYLAEHLTPRLTERLDQLLQDALDNQSKVAPSEVVKVIAAEAAKVAPQTAAVKPANVLPTPDQVMKGLALPDFQPGSRIATTLKDWSGTWRNKPAMLGWLTLRQISDRFKDTPGVQQFTELSQRMAGKAKALMTEGHLIDQEWAKLSKTESTDMQKLMIESTMEQMWPDRPLSAEANSHIDKENAILVAKHAELAKRYNALPDRVKTIFQQAQAKMRKDWDERGRLLRERIVEQYRAELNQHSEAEIQRLAGALKRDRAELLKGRGKAETRSLRNLWGDLDEHAERLAQMRGPYFPLMRFGEHVVVAKSADYQAAGERLADAQERLQALNKDDDTLPETLDKARQEVKEAARVVEDLKDNERHYIVEFYESPSEAKARQKQLAQHFAAQGKPMAVYAQRRAEHFGKLDAVAPSFMRKLQDSLTANLPDKNANDIRMAVRDLYIQSLPERSAMKSQLRRLNVGGVKVGEMRRSFAASVMRSSWHLSRLEYGSRINEQLSDLVNGQTDEQKVVGGELARRLSSILQEDTSNQFIAALTATSYMTYLGLSPSFFVMNAMQPWQISLPIMAGRYGLKRSAAELGKAFNEVGAAMAASLKEQKTWRFELDLEKFDADNGERAMLEDLFNKGIIDVTIEHDMGSVAGGQEETVMGQAMKYASLPAHHTEVLNRVMTALAAYRLARASGLAAGADHATATKYAESVVADTHLDYTPENAPRFMRSASLGGLGRIVFQFKKYMQGMIFLHGKLIRDSFSGNTDEAKTARKGLTYLLGMEFAVSGAVGLPIAAPVSLIAAVISKLYPPDDQPEFYQVFYSGVKDAIGETAARALFKGVPAALGIDVSNKIGFGDLLNPLAFMPQGKTDSGGATMGAALLALSGPAVSMTANWLDGMQMASEDPAKAATKILPKFMADPIRAIDRYNRGVTNRRGDTIMDPDEFGPLGLMMKAVGFESTKVGDMYDARSAMLSARTARDDARKSLLREAVRARQSGDGDKQADVQEKIQEWNVRHPELRVTGKNVTASAKTSRITAQSLRDGVKVRKQDRELANRLGLRPATNAAGS